MVKANDKSLRRLGVAFNLSSLIGATTIASIGEGYSWNWTLGGLLIFFLSVYALSFYFTQIRTGLWSFVHRKVEQLDEREHQLSYEALRFSYATFSIVALILLMLVTLSDDSSVALWFEWVNGRPLFLAMMLFAHSLPAALLAWRAEVV
ncbi:hypothetical protein K8I28_15655 [bacterium]|nr:hypothetical protein [bacterium]